MTPLERWHGTRHGYDIMKCRCDGCRACNADRVARWRRARKLGRPQPHPWREEIMCVWSDATSVWLELREAAGNGWLRETAEYDADHGAPQLKDVMVTLARISR